jgi:ATP phosphoribosyltransferase regulatory subunit
MAARGIETNSICLATAYGRRVAYTTGFVFEMHRRGDGDEPLVAGGRYDGLMTQLGADTPIPAVGFSIWIETLTRAANPSANRGAGSAS